MNDETADDTANVFIEDEFEIEEEKMAKIETANLRGEKAIHANVSGAVGIGEKNERNDVLLIQALFMIMAGSNDIIAQELFGLGSRELPEVTGVFDNHTGNTIWKFQQKNARRLLSVDGKIHPASYRNRLLKDPYKKRVMMITLLNMEAELSTNSRFKGDLTFAIKQYAPSIVFTA